MAGTATATKEASTASQAVPSVLTELGLGNRMKPADSSEGSDVAPKSDAQAVDLAATQAAPDAKAGDDKGQQSKADAASDGKHDTATSETKPEDADKAEIAKLTKQLKDTRDAFTQERQINKTMLAKQQAIEQKIELLTKKIDGTYDETKDAPKEPTIDEATRSERVATSHWAAIDQYGEDYVMKTIWADDAPFRQFDHDPAIQARVFASKVPILEAIKVVKEHEARAKYGSDPEAMRKAIEQEVRADIEKRVRQEMLKKAAGTFADEVHGLANVRQATDTKPADAGRLNFDTLFPGFNKTAG